MSYATQQDLIDRYGERELIELTDRAEPPADEIDAAVVAAALADADELINGYVSRRYRVPLSPVPGLIQRLACDIARFFLHDDRPTDTVEKAFDSAKKTLLDISAGRAELQAAGVESPAAPGGSVQVSGPGRVFTAGTLKDY